MWINHHLKTAGVKRVVTNFGSDLMDGEVLTHVLHQVDPENCSLAPLDIADLENRAETILENADKTGCRKFVNASDIVQGNARMNLAFVATIFSKFPNIGDTNKELALENELQKLREENQKLNQVNSELTGSLNNLKQQLDDTKTSHNNLEESLNDVKQQLDDTKTSHDNLKVSLNDVKQQLDDTLNAHSKLKEDHDQLQRDYIDVNEQRDNLEQEKDKLSNPVSHKECEEALAKANAEIELLKARILELENLLQSQTTPINPPPTSKTLNVIIRQGWLSKESGRATIALPKISFSLIRRASVSSGIGKQFQRRWFILKGEFLSYYKDPSNVSKPNGAIYLRSARVFELTKEASLVKTQQQSEFAFELTTDEENRTYVIYASSFDDRRAWTEAIKQVKATHFTLYGKPPK
eukprot:TRINITY_DN2373_c0_g1_i2.p1 TRINITY_DN2373_c0_g1~~TRINITY_DN2373_c0_g1_i2.p1  ORF type:complete len:410 (+),score=86.18 TRINITY_DN2373_c0_g1_i2:479-1708(+)